jgi:hypothetical protein
VDPNHQIRFIRVIRDVLYPPLVTWNHSWSLDETRDSLLESSFIIIPTEIILRIFGLLSVSDLGRISLVCRRFKMIVDHDVIWQPKCNSK